MKKIVALMRKEYLETRLLTLAFLIVGVILSFVHKPLDVEPTSASLSVGEFNFLSRFSFGGLVASWLNLVVLSASTFAREREKGTMTVLRRITSDWRVAAIAKFGYAFLSSLAIVVVFFLITLGGRSLFSPPVPYDLFRIPSF